MQDRQEPALFVAVEEDKTDTSTADVVSLVVLVVVVIGLLGVTLWQIAS